MTIFGNDRIKKFRGRLYSRNLSTLLRKGAKGLHPLEKYKSDDKGRPLVPTREITRFFLKEAEKAAPLCADDYLAALYELLRELTLGAEAVSFDCGFSVSEEDIQAADNKPTIALLTTNIIITYFNNLKTYKGTVDKSLLSPDLKALIAKAGDGRDYAGLVDNTLAVLAQRLDRDRPWREYLEDLNDTDLVCRLAGALLPDMEEGAMAGILDKSHKEIQEIDSMFSKILTARARLVAREGNPGTYLKSMEKLDTAVLSILEKTDQYLAAAHRLMGVLYLSYAVVLGQTDASLRQNLVWLFLNARPDGDSPPDIQKNLGMAHLRYRLNMLFNYPDITRYASTFKNAEPFGSLYFDLFRLLFKESVETASRTETDLDQLSRTLKETARAVENLGLEEERLMDEKQALRQAFTGLIHDAGSTGLAAVMELCDLVCRATQDRSREIMAAVRPALIKACYADLCTASSDTALAVSDIKKHLNAYALHYKPQREFYRIFFDIHAGPASSTMPGLANGHKSFALALLMVFADAAAMKALLPEDRISQAAALLADLQQKK
ncbi:MAG: hypothetical protein HUN04_18285 [Desulfobacter sp.]|nr:MAG: hypothetical protein HUN04_18285 [Desulfobacter sp.]